MNILNVKSSFEILENHNLSEDNCEYLYYHAGSVKILKSGEFTFSIMGSLERFVNVTGCNSLENVDAAVNHFKKLSKINKTQNLKINSISFKLCVDIEEINLLRIKSSHCNIFNVKTYPRFTGICFKHKKLRIAGNFFHQSKKIICMGAKSWDEMYIFVKDLKKIGFTIID